MRAIAPRARWGPEDVAAHLRARDDLRRYLDAITDLDPGDGSLIRAALNDIARAYGVTGSPESLA